MAGARPTRPSIRSAAATRSCVSSPVLARSLERRVRSGLCASMAATACSSSSGMADFRPGASTGMPRARCRRSTPCATRTNWSACAPPSQTWLDDADRFVRPSLPFAGFPAHSALDLGVRHVLDKLRQPPGEAERVGDFAASLAEEMIFERLGFRCAGVDRAPEYVIDVVDINLEAQPVAARIATGDFFRLVGVVRDHQARIADRDDGNQQPA